MITVGEIPMIASLPMYTRPELDDTIAHFWDLIRKNLNDKGIKHRKPYLRMQKA